MSKKDLVAAIALKTGLTKVDSAKALDATLKTIEEAMKADEKVTLIGFGTFSVNHRAERIGRNPRTKTAMTIPAKKVVRFKPGSDMAF